MSGPAPRPAAINALLGNPSNKPPAREPEPLKGAPRPPRDLSREARAEWRRVVPQLAAIGLLSVVDRAALVIYVEAWADYVSTTKLLREVGDSIEGTRGTLVRHPAALARKEAIDTMTKFVREFGLTPSARARITLPGADPAADMESLLGP